MANEIKVGDKVRIANDAPAEYRYGFNYRLRSQVSEVIGLDDEDFMAAILPLCVNDKDLWFQIPTKYLIKVEDEEKKEPKFKKGDRVKYVGKDHPEYWGVIFTIDGEIFYNDYHKNMQIDSIRCEKYNICNVPLSDLVPYTEPTSPKIKVGDFVRVLENLHEPICLEGDLHLEITNIPPHAVSQKEWKVISVEVRRDCAGRIYTLKHDDSFIYNIPEDCVERVEPKEQTEETSPNVNHSDIDIDTIVARGYISNPNSFFKCDWDAYTADLAKEIALKITNKKMDNDPEEVAEYAVSVAKAVVENLKKK